MYPDPIHAEAGGATLWSRALMPLWWGALVVQLILFSSASAIGTEPGATISIRRRSIPAAIRTSAFVEVNGLRLHYLDWGNHGGPVIVCVHGLTSHAHAFDGFARRCAGRFHVVALDVRGRGDSAWSPAGEYTMAAYTADLVAFIVNPASE